MRRRIRQGKGGRRAGASSAVMGTVLALVLWGAPAASAGGLTSVLVVSSASSEATGLRYPDEQFAQLDRLLGEPGVGSLTKAPKADLLGARQIDVTWLLHDVDPWRLDQVYPETGSETVWIHTVKHLEKSRSGYWHRAEKPTELRALLKKLGVLGPVAGAAGSGGDAATAARAASASTSASGDDSGWMWAIPGLAAGLALGAGGSLLIRRAAGRPDAGPPRGGPRQELIDV
jgi:hypothetical protein